MRYVCYKEGYPSPCVSHSDNTANIGEIIGGEIRPDGTVILHVLRFGNDEVIVVPNCQWPKDLDDVMMQRSDEMINHKNPYKMVYPKRSSRIVAQDDATLWALGLDPECDPVDYSINARIRSLREMFQLDQFDFAEKIGISQIKLQHIEEKACPVTYDLICKIIEVFRVRKPWLTKGDGMILEKEVKDEQQVERKSVRDPVLRETVRSWVLGAQHGNE